MTYEAEVLADAPLIYWRLGEASGTSAADTSGNSHTGTYSGSPTVGVAGLLTGDANKAATFHSASDDLLQSAASFGPTTVATFSTEAIVNLTAAVGGAPNIWELCDPLGADPGVISLQYDASNISVFFQGTSNLPAAAFPYSLNTTYHLVGTFDGTQLLLYMNGALVATTPAVDAGAPVAIPFCWVAGNFGGGGFGTDGTVDECAFYDTVLSADRVAAHYAQMINPTGGGTFYTPPVIFDEGPILPDSQGLSRLLFRHYPSRPRFQTVWKLATNPITYSLTQPFPLITLDDVRMGNVPIGQQYNDATYLHVYYGPETVDAAEAARLVASGIGTVT
jgi:hypothetical protein